MTRDIIAAVQRPYPMAHPLVSVGSRFGMLTITGRDGRRVIAACDCGAGTKQDRQAVAEGRIVSCGCFARGSLGRRKRTHGKYRSPEYTTWLAMRRRCSNPAEANYHGRGITVCDRWLSFNNFLADMGPRPSDEHSIDRINNDGNYEPTNCRWATKQTQSWNSRSVQLITFNGETMSMNAWARRLGIHVTTLMYRLRAGWSLELALSAVSR